MKMSEAIAIINSSPQHKGFRVSFEKKEGCILRSGYFPEGEEPLISTEDDAWILARDFAKKTTGKYINIYVVDHNYSPVKGYALKMIENR